MTIGPHTFCFAEGYNHFANNLAEDFPSERDALQQYVKMLKEVERAGTKLFNVNAYDYLTSLFSNPLLLNVLSGTSMKLELRRESLPLFTFAHSQNSFIQSSWRLRGYANLIVQSLVGEIERNGGQVVCNADVEELNVHKGRIVSVSCKSGCNYEGDMFISGIHPVRTFQMIGAEGKLKPAFLKRLNSLENTVGMFTASLLLKPKALHYFNYNKYVYRKANVWSFHEDVGGVGGVMISCRVPENNSEFAQQLDILTPMPFNFCQRWADTCVGNRGEDYMAMKERLAAECIHLAEMVIPGLGGMVAACYTSTPLTYRDYTQTPYGSAFGIRKDCRQPLLGVLSSRTPIPNLLLTGQSLVMHGVEGVTMTALQTCAEVLGREYMDSFFKN